MTDIRDEDLMIEVYTNGTGLVAYRLTHQPTGVSAEVRDEQNRFKAHKKALEVLKQRLEKL